MMVRMIRPDGGVCLVDEARVSEYRAAGYRTADDHKGVSKLDTPDGKKLRPLRKRKGLELTQ